MSEDTFVSAKTLAESERWRRNQRETITVYQAEIASLRAEVERLTKERDAIRLETLEQCAEVCATVARVCNKATKREGALQCAAAIRAMK